MKKIVQIKHGKFQIYSDRRKNGVALVPEAGLLGRKTQSLSDSNTQPPI